MVLPTVRIQKTLEAAEPAIERPRGRLAMDRDVNDLGDLSVIRTTVRTIEELLAVAIEYEESLRARLAHTMADQDTTSRRRRRDHSPELKRELVRQCLQPGASVSSIAMAHGINANLVFKWRREHRAAMGAGPGPAQTSAPALLPITIASAPPDGTTQAPHPVSMPCRP